MNTVDALNEFGMALCGDGFVPQPDRTDAEVIDKIAKDGTGGGAGGGGGTGGAALSV